MLIKQVHLKKIKTGEVSLAFRKWKSRRVKKGSLIKTAIGQVEILEIEEISRNKIGNEEAILAGYNSGEELLKILEGREGNLYKIQLAYHSADPRIELRNRTDLPPSEMEAILNKLQRLDKYSKQGKWTLEILQLIQDYPEMRAADLAHIIQKEKHWLKTNVRKLKNMGLTISHKIGYSISPLGKQVLEKLNA